MKGTTKDTKDTKKRRTKNGLSLTVFLRVPFFVSFVSFVVPLTVFSLVHSRSAHADEMPPTAVVPRATGAITIDGRLDEGEWRRAPRVGPFLRYDGEPWGDVIDTRLLWDETAFYLGAVVRDSDVWSDWRHHDDPLWKGDVVEWYLSPFPDGTPYVELEFNPHNALLDIFLTDNPQKGGLSLWDWDAKGIRHAVTVQGTLFREDADTGWTLEVALPWEVFRFAPGVPPRPGNRWRGTLIYYNHPKRDATIEHRQWAPSHHLGWPHHPERFGTFEFGGPAKGAPRQ